MNNFKKIGFVASLLLASGFVGASTSVSTNTYFLGDITYSSFDIGNNPVLEGAFTDEFNFSLTVDNVFNALVTGSKVAIPEFTSIVLSNGDTGTTFDFSSTFSAAQISGFPSLSAGSYTLFVSGIANSRLDSSAYSISGSAVSPVPEPSTIALMLGGLGLVGFMAARRRNQGV